MWKQLATAVPGALALAWVRRIVRHDAELAVPSGSPISHGSGPDPDRVLILGSPVVQGVGVASYDLAFSGHLARRLASRTGRGADVEVRGIDKFDALHAAQVIRDENLSRFDLVLVMGGVTEIVRLMPIAQYRRTLGTLLDAIEARGESAPPVLIAGVAPFLQDMDLPRFVRGWMQRRIDRQNRVTRQMCDQSGAAVYVDFDPTRITLRHGRDVSGVYESWAVNLLPAVTRAVSRGTARRAPEQNESARARALSELRIDGNDSAVDRIVEMAREMLGVEVAALNVIDSDRQWSTSTTGARDFDMPREQAICNTTIQQPGAYVVEDLDADPAFQDSVWVTGESHVRFYAGYPVEAPGGERVGALCVMDSRPRHFTASEKATLRDLALAAQAALWQKKSA